ncbi:hypothetical protein DVH24_019617 [Malus domestica]|uniref:Uncharacterized protein n=1 Tax=Malus domestica TaxID=3750 RepID=A0A498I1E9_MALDO|nr:hypothetical protein DVH24_019617 [Malus domestica]
MLGANRVAGGVVCILDLGGLIWFGISSLILGFVSGFGCGVSMECGTGAVGCSPFLTSPLKPRPSKLKSSPPIRRLKVNIDRVAKNFSFVPSPLHAETLAFREGLVLVLTRGFTMLLSRVTSFRSFP